MLNHYYHYLLIRIIDRVFISFYVIYIFQYMESFNLNDNQKEEIYYILFKGIVAIIIAIYLRFLFENNFSTDEKSIRFKEMVSVLCTITHLYSHFMLIYGYLFLVSTCSLK